MKRIATLALLLALPMLFGAANRQKPLTLTVKQAFAAIPEDLRFVVEDGRVVWEQQKLDGAIKAVKERWEGRDYRTPRSTFVVRRLTDSETRFTLSEELKVGGIRYKLLIEADAPIGVSKETTSHTGVVSGVVHQAHLMAGQEWVTCKITLRDVLVK